MTAQRDLIKPHVDAILAEAHSAKIPTDVVGRELLDAAIKIWMQERSIDDIASELTFCADNIDPDTDYPFMRP